MAGSQVLHFFGTLFLLVAMVCLMGAIFTDYWIESSLGGTGFRNAGLWKACFFKYRLDNNYNMYGTQPLALSGCYSVNSRAFSDYQNWINPSWLQSVKGLLVSCMFLNVASLFCCAFYLLQNRDVYIVPINIINWVAVLMICCGMTIYHFMSTDRDYLPLPDSTQFSSSYTAGVCSLFFLLAASCCSLAQGVIIYWDRPKSMFKH